MSSPNRRHLTMSGNRQWLFGTVMLGAVNLLTACGSSSSSGTLVARWVSGADIVNQNGVYGTLGTAAPSNVPGAREGAVSWTDSNGHLGHLWLFGGLGHDSTGNIDRLNDLWRFDGRQWTWVSGADVVDQQGVYGTQGTASPSNVPGARAYAISWIDSAGNLWLFGGYGYDSAGNLGYLNDLWRFDGYQWTWIDGSDVVNQQGVYGMQGTAAPSNVPGARDGAISWIDSIGNLWLFGGGGYDSALNLGGLNDLWKYDGSQWTWVSGADVINQEGVYGAMGTASPSNVPGARTDAVSWIDQSGNLWLFGAGGGLDSAGNLGFLNDLWRFDGSQWTWVSGNDVINQKGVYGMQGTADPSNVPGARGGAISWIDSTGNLWLFGGAGWDSAAIGGELNDLWRYDGSQWTWVSGADDVNQQGIYGTKGTASPSNAPGARRRAVSWIDLSGNLWLFGGIGYESTVALDLLNDLWELTP